jgi:hypothetical protein
MPRRLTKGGTRNGREAQTSESSKEINQDSDGARAKNPAASASPTAAKRAAGQSTHPPPSQSFKDAIQNSYRPESPWATPSPTAAEWPAQQNPHPPPSRTERKPFRLTDRSNGASAAGPANELAST